MSRRYWHKSWSGYYHAVLAELEKLDESAYLSADETVNAEAAYDNQEYTAKEYAKKVANDRDYAAAKLFGELYQ